MTEQERDEMFETIMELASGRYQQRLLMGEETWSGSSLKGEAKNWGGQYAKSRQALIDRLQEADLGIFSVGKAMNSSRRWQSYLFLLRDGTTYKVEGDIIPFTGAIN